MDGQWHWPAALQEWMVQQASELLARRDGVLPDYFGIVLEAWTVEELQRRTVIDLGLPHGDGTRTAEPSAAPPPQAEPPTAPQPQGAPLSLPSSSPLPRREPDEQPPPPAQRRPSLPFSYLHFPSSRGKRSEGVPLNPIRRLNSISPPKS